MIGTSLIIIRIGSISIRIPSIHINGQKKKFFIVGTSYHPDAQKCINNFHYYTPQPSRQIQLIAQILNSKNIQYYRERTFKNLTTVENRPFKN